MFLETIKCENGKLINLEFHQRRIRKVRKVHYPLLTDLILQDYIEVPSQLGQGLFRCRVLYSENIHKIEFLPHHNRNIRNLKLVEDNTIDYKYKYSDRKGLNDLFAQRGNCDDILIVKENYITDSYAANVLLFDGNVWWTPDTPLLKGTQRERLLSEHKIQQSRITVLDLSSFIKVGLINALYDMTDMPIIEMCDVEGM